MSKTTDYSFMKSGFDNVNNTEQEVAQNITAIMVHFMENAMNTASIYATHAKRREVVSEDIKRALMLEVFFFQKRTNVQDKINEIKDELYNGDSDTDDEFEINNEDASDTDQFIESECTCALCNCMNTIYSRWEKWTPQTPIHTILKNRLDNWEQLS